MKVSNDNARPGVWEELKEELMLVLPEEVSEGFQRESNMSYILKRGWDSGRK